MGPKWGVQKAPPCGPLWGQLPILWFWAPEGEWGCGIGKGGCPAVCILGGGTERPTVCIFGRSVELTSIVTPTPIILKTSYTLPTLLVFGLNYNILTFLFF